MEVIFEKAKYGGEIGTDILSMPPSLFIP